MEQLFAILKEIDNCLLYWRVMMRAIPLLLLLFLFSSSLGILKGQDTVISRLPQGYFVPREAVPKKDTGRYEKRDDKMVTEVKDSLFITYEVNDDGSLKVTDTSLYKIQEEPCESSVSSKETNIGSLVRMDRKHFHPDEFEEKAQGSCSVLVVVGSDHFVLMNPLNMRRTVYKRSEDISINKR